MRSVSYLCIAEFSLDKNIIKSKGLKKTKWVDPKRKIVDPNSIKPSPHKNNSSLDLEGDLHKINTNFYLSVPPEDVEARYHNEYYNFLLNHGSSSDPESIFRKKKSRSKSKNGLDFPFHYQNVPNKYRRIRETNDFFNRYAEKSESKMLDEDLGILVVDPKLALAIKKSVKAKAKNKIQAKADRFKEEEKERRAKQKVKHIDSHIDFNDDFISLEYKIEAVSRNNENKLRKRTGPVSTSVDDPLAREWLSNHGKSSSAPILKVDGNVVVPNYRNGEKIRSSGFTKSESAAFRKNKLERKKESRAHYKLQKSFQKLVINTESGGNPCYTVADVFIKRQISTFFDAMSGDKNLSFYMRIGNLCYQLYRSSNVLDYLSAIYAYTGSTADLLIDFSYTVLKDLVVDNLGLFQEWSKPLDGVEAKVVTESGINSISTVLESAISSQLFVVLRNFVLTAASVQWFGKDLSRMVFKTVGEGSYSFVNLAINIVDGITKLCVMGSNWASGMSFNDAFLSSDPYTHIVGQAKSLLAYKDMLYTGVPIEGYKEKVSFCIELGNIIATFKKLKESINPRSNHYSSFHSYKLQCEMLYAQLAAQSNAMARTPAPLVVLYGPPGTGKSHLLTYVCTIWSGIMGRKFEHTHVYSKTDPKWWEGHNPMEQKIIHYSEIGRLKREISVQKGETDMTELLSIIDTLPYVLPMAFGQKGTIYANPELVITDCNNEYGDADALFHEPNAAGRRMLHIRQTVLPDFRLSGTEKIDSSKSCKAGGHPLDRYVFEIYTSMWDREKCRWERFYILKNGNLSDFTLLITQYFRDFIGKAIESKNLMSDMEVYDRAKHGPCRAESVLLDDGKFEACVIASEAGEDKQEVENLGDVPIRNRDDPQKLNGDDPLCDVRQGLHPVGGVKMESEKLKPLPDPKSKIEINWYYFKSLLSAAWLFFIHSLFLNMFTDVGNVTILGIPINLHWSTAYVIIAKIGLFPFGWPLFILVNVFTGSLTYYKIISYMFRNFLFLRAKQTKQELLKKLYVLWGDGIANPFVFKETEYYKLMNIATSLTTLYVAGRGMNYVYNLMKKKDVQVSSEQGEFVTLLKNTEAEKYGAGSLLKRVPNNRSQKIWTNMAEIAPPKFTGDLADFHRCVTKNVRYCKFDGGDGEVELDFYALGICNGFLLTNKHNLRGIEEGELRVSNTDGVHFYVSDDGKYTPDQKKKVSGWFNVRFDATNLIDLGNDLIIISSFALRFSDITKHICETPIVSPGKSFFIDTEIWTVPVQSVIEVNNKFLGTILVDGYISYDYPNHRPGLCGLPVLSSIGRGFAISGIHFGGSESNDFCVSRPISRVEILSAINNRPKIFKLSSESRISKIQLEEPVYKSMTRYEILQNLTYYGKVPGSIILDTKSRLQRTKIGSAVHQFFLDQHGLEGAQFGKPMMRATEQNGEYISPYNKCMRNITKPRECLKPKVLSKIVNLLSVRFIDGLSDLERLDPLTSEQAVNGVQDDAFIRRINASTSAGFGYSGIKANYLPIVDENGNRALVEDLASDVHACLENYLDDRSNRFVYVAKLKDEPRPIEKCLNGSTRVFFMGPLDGLVVYRMFTMPYYSCMVERNDLFCTAVGVDMHRGSDTLYHKIVDFSSNIIEGDYGAYDQCMPFGVGNAVNEIILNVLQAKGYNQTALKITRGILTDSCFPLIEVLKDVFEAPALQPSGKFATAEDNSLRGLILLMYAWIDGGFEDKYGDFFDWVLPVTYGDDLLASSRCQDFNCIYYSNFVEKYYGMTFTSSDKKQIDYEFLDPSSMSFLKRSFVYSEFYGRVMCPLGHSSIIRALTWNMPSNCISDVQQILQTCVSMLWEYAIFSPETYSLFKTLLKKEMHEKYLIPMNELNKTFPSLPDIKASILGEEESEDLHTSLPEEEKMPCLGQNVVLWTESNSTPSNSSESNGIANTKDIIYLMLLEYEQEKASLVKDLEECKEISYMKMSDTAIVDAIRRNEPPIPQEYVDKLFRLEDVVATINRLRQLSSPNNRYRTQSGEVSSGIVEYEVKTENFQNVTGDSIKNVSFGKSAFPNVGQNEPFDLNHFSERPIEIDTFDIPIATDVTKVYDIWDLWTRNPTIRAKLRNFAYFSATLHARITISGSPFHSGRVLISYQPLATSNRTLTTMATALAGFPTMRPLWINYHSQSPGAITMDVKANKPVEITMPYINVNPTCRLYNSDTVISDVTPFADVLPLGQLYFNTINPVASASTTPTTVRVQIICWATEVKLGCPTGTQMVITTESGHSEFEVGPVERWSTRAAAFAGALTAIPTISPFAYASEQMFSGLGSLASLFGWSKPVIIDEPVLIKGMPYQNGAHIIGYDTTMRITLDPKQELSIDPRVAGIEVDDMTIQGIGQRLSYYDSFSWNSSDVTMSPIYYTRNSARIETQDTGALRVFKQPTSAAFAATPFTYWNGNHHYRMEIVSNLFQRGVLGIMFEPDIQQSALINLNLSTNKQSMIVVDIQETQVLDFCVGWAQPREWCTVQGGQGIKEYGSIMSVLNPENCNGYIVIFPFTRLQSPDGSPVRINMYVAIDNLQVNYLSHRHDAMLRALRTESGVSCPEEVSCLELNVSSADLKDASSHHFGELPVSFRSLLKRFIWNFRYTTTSGGTTGRQRVVGSNIPLNVLPYGTTAAPLQFDMFSYLRYAFVGMRGGVRKRLHIVHKTGYAAQNQVKVQNNLATTGIITPTAVFETGQYTVDSLNGTVSFAWNVNSGIEFELPFYSPNLFHISFADDDVGALGASMLGWVKSFTANIDVTEGSLSGVINESSAAGEDFCFLRFQGAPYYST